MSNEQEARPPREIRSVNRESECVEGRYTYHDLKIEETERKLSKWQQMEPKT